MSGRREQPIKPVRPSKAKKGYLNVGPLVADFELQAGDGQEVPVPGCLPCGGEGGQVKPKTRRAPHEPTNDEIREHELTHTPYRSWCSHCVRARALAAQHHPMKDEEKAFATMHLDYWFMRDKAGAELVPVVTLKDDKTKAVKAHVVPGKGNVEGAADMLIKDIGKCGHMHTVILKCDQEPALIDLRNKMQERRTPTTLVEESKSKDSRSNGVIERAIQSVEGIVRTMKFALEHKLKITIECTHPVMTWLVEHAAETLNKFHVGSDGRTAYERMKGKSYKGEVFEFGRSVMHRVAGEVQGGSMQARFFEGVWVGKSTTSDEHILIMENLKIVKARTIVAKPENESWNVEKVMAIKACAGKGLGHREEHEEGDQRPPGRWAARSSRRPCYS